MTWNEPGKTDPKNENTNNKDPWTGKPRKPASPPDLDVIFKKLFQQFSSFFSGKKPNTPFTPSLPTHSKEIVYIGLGIIFFLWIVSGFFIVDSASKGVILRLGRYTETVEPGLHWVPRFIETNRIVNDQKISSYFYEAQMLTKDENIVSVAIAVQYRISNAQAFLFNVVNPQESLQQATASVLRQVIGRMNLDAVLTSGREQIRQQVQTLLSQIMKSYQTGFTITDVTIQPAKAPEEVKEAFDDAIKAQEDEQRIVNQAEAYAMQVEPIARGQAQRLTTDAKAYKQQVVMRAQGDVMRFLALLPQYQKSPNLIRTRLYYDTLELVLSQHSKIFLDTLQGNQMIYLPLDKLPAPFSVVPTTASISNPTPLTSTRRGAS